jgi:hypothetical protein
VHDDLRAGQQRHAALISGDPAQALDAKIADCGLSCLRTVEGGTNFTDIKLILTRRVP